MHQLTRLPAVLLLVCWSLVLSGLAVYAQTPAAAPPATSAPVAPASPAPLDPSALQAKVDEYMKAQVQTNGFTGSILLASKGTPLVSKGYGFANIEWQIPNTPQTKFRIGSITKQFTSMVVMQLREQGKLKLEDSLCQFVTPCPDAWKPVTIHHLLTHTSGIPTYTGLAEWRKVNMVPKTVDEMIGFFRDLPLQWTPGEKFAYNNSGYFLLGVVIEKAAGKKYEDVLREQIFKPLGMQNSGYDWSATIIPQRASGYSGRPPDVRNAAALDMQQPYAAGSLYSTTEDLLTWDQALYTEKLIPAAAKELMWTPFKNNYAYGWNVTAPAAVTHGHRRIQHSGGINGFSSIIVRQPDTNVTVIVLTNNDSLPGGAGTVARDLFAIYYGQPYSIPKPRIVAKVDPALYDQYVGIYEVTPEFKITITRQGGSLFAQVTGQGRAEIFPEAETRFFYKVVDAVIHFEKDASGKVTSLVLEQGGRKQSGKKID